MKTFVVSGLSMLLAVTAASAAGSPGRLDYGRELFGAWCSNCHASEPGQSSFAPTLFGIVGRKSGSVEGFPYSPRISTLNLVWGANTLDPWLKALSSESPTTSIRHVGVQDAWDRDAIIAYLASLKP